MPAGQGKDAERFAAALESRTTLGAAGDADLAQELEIVAMLRSRGAAFAPGPEVKERAKQRLMAVLAAEQSGQQTAQRTAQHAGPRPAPRSAPHAGPRHAVAPPPSEAELTAPLGRLVEPGSPGSRDDVDPTAETARMAPITARQQPVAAASSGADEDAETRLEPTPLRGSRGGRRARHSIASRPAGRARSAGRPAAASLRRRVALVGSAAMVMMLAIAGGGVFASRDALPGENLYAVKRVAESAGLAFTFDDASKARRHLEIAATRLSEVERLTALQAQAAPAPEVFSTAMDEFDAATDEGSRLLLASARSEGGDTAATDLHAWAAEQSARLTELRPALPAEADADSSIELLERLLGRTEGAGGAGSCDDDCVSRRASETAAPESDEADATGGVTTTPGEDGSTDRSRTDEAPRTATRTPTGEDPPLLPDLLPEGSRDGEEDTTRTNDDEDSTSTSDAESGNEGSEDNVEVPLPLLPPITLPPLLPGMPGITIG